SPDFAVPSLRATAAACELVLVITQPDRRAGRGRKMAAPAVKVAAEALGIPVIQPRKLRNGKVAAELRALELDVIVVAAYGRILPLDILEAPRLGCINVHASILPRWRGAAPIQRAVLAGDRETGVAIMRMAEGLDTGPVYETATTPIGEAETSGELFSRLADLGGATLEAFLRRFPDVPPPTPQDDAAMTLAPMLSKEEGAIDWGRPARAIADHIRGMDPWPGATCERGDDRLKLFTARVSDVGPGDAAAGTVLQVDRRGLHVACAEGAVVVAELQPPGKRRMPAKAYAAGKPFAAGERLT
ncbi:MAG: methionyl-tRNA formyltransferase, partial [Myxococcales bacterium]|nr:methionyl-tRNA formyltransferase [Myxococcales bacterium]